MLFAFKFITITLLIILSGIFSGLNLSMFSLKLSDLERKAKLGNKDAEKIYSVRKHGNLLLCTLLFGNVAVNAFIAIILNSIFAGITAGIISTGIILIFGEIIPQAVFSRFALLVGSKTVLLLRILIFIFYPVAFPISWILDKALGNENPIILSKGEIAEIIKAHEDSSDSSIDSDEEKFILGALRFSDKTAESIVTQRNSVFSLEKSIIIRENILKEIKNKGFTRIPVYSKNPDNIVGILFAKMLIGFKPDNKTVYDVCEKDNLIYVNKDIHLDNLFNLFILKKNHICFVYDEYKNFLGIVTLEDVIEEILTTEIIDETDRIIDR